MMVDIEWILIASLAVFGLILLVVLLKTGKKNRQLREENVLLKEENRQLTTQLRELSLFREHQEKSYLDKIDALKQNHAHNAESFKSLSSEVLKANNEIFLQLANSKLEHWQHHIKNEMEKRDVSMDQMLKPLKESLDKVDKNHHDLRSTLNSTQVSFQEQIKSLIQTHTQLQGETHHLAKALRNPAFKGRWGEMHLRRALEITGMVEHCDFNEQPQGSSGVRPDMIIRLPGDREVIVDSKSPLQSYLEALETDDELKRKRLLAEHARCVRLHITQLSSKLYWEQFKKMPEFVVLFLPGENFFSAALQEDPHLIDFGIEQKVLLATPTTLIALLRTIAFGWNQERLAQNAEKISVLGKEFYERLESFTHHFQELRRGIEKSVEAYNGALGCFRNRVCVTARKLQEAGVARDREVLEPDAIEKQLKN